MLIHSFEVSFRVKVLNMFSKVQRGAHITAGAICWYAMQKLVS